MNLPIRVHAASDIGRVHHTNEDSFAVAPGEDGGLLLLVCDGMGGMGRGDEASSLAVDVIIDQVARSTAQPHERLREAIQKADDAIRQALCSGATGRPGCTAAAAYVIDGRAFVSWVGDSRVYLVRDGKVVARTRDHKLVEALVEAGELTPEEARHSMLSSVLTRALGGRKPNAPEVEVSALEPAWELAPGDRLLLSSDGLIDLVSDQEVPVLLGERPPEEAARVCVDTANSRGGHDNITVIVAEWLADASGAHLEPSRSARTSLQPATGRRAPLPPHRESDDDDPSSGALVRDLMHAPVLPVAGFTPPAAATRSAAQRDPRRGPSAALVALVILLAGALAWGGVQLARAALAPAPAAAASR